MPSYLGTTASQYRDANPWDTQTQTQDERERAEYSADYGVGGQFNPTTVGGKWYTPPQTNTPITPTPIAPSGMPTTTPMITPTPITPSTLGVRPTGPLSTPTGTGTPIAPIIPPVNNTIPQPPIAGTTSVTNPTIPINPITASPTSLPDTNMLAARKKLSTFGGI